MWEYASDEALMKVTSSVEPSDSKYKGTDKDEECAHATEDGVDCEIKVNMTSCIVFR